MLYAPEERGQGLVEYALILILIAIALIGLLFLITDELESLFSRIASKIPA